MIAQVGQHKCLLMSCALPRQVYLCYAMALDGLGRIDDGIALLEEAVCATAPHFDIQAES